MPFSIVCILFVHKLTIIPLYGILSPYYVFLFIYLSICLYLFSNSVENNAAKESFSMQTKSIRDFSQKIYFTSHSSDSLEEKKN